MAGYDAIVIGSGIGGLASATRLSQDGFRTLLLEASDEFGGYIRPVVYGEYSFDLGLHYIGKLGSGGSFREILDQLGLEDFEFIELDPEGFDRYVFPGYEFNFCKGREQLAERLIGDFPREEKGICKFLDLTMKIDQACEPHRMVRGSHLGWIPYLLKNPVMLHYGRSTYQDVLDSITNDRKLQAVLSAPLFDVALGPRRASAAVAFGVWSYFLQGAYYPRGGSRALRDAFVKRLRQVGAVLVHSDPVKSLIRKNGKWLVRTENGNEYSSAVVVSNIDPKVTICSLLERKLVPHREFKKANRLKPSGSIISAFIGTDLDLSSYIGSCNISRFSGWDLDPYYDAWLGNSIPRPEQAIFLNSPSVRDPTGGFAPEGHHTLQILMGGNIAGFDKWVQLKPEERGEDYTKLKSDIVKGMVAEAEAEIPALSEHITFSECVTPVECVDRVRAPEGGIYGPAHIPSQMGPGRYTSLECGVEGLFFAGAGTFGCGLFSCAASGLLAAEKAINHLGR
ncbi:phytoene desaturase family protein [Microbulbifer sediminum]|uniref:phytoene desaturase family protein n=1 Tax=Microbulbifer sediminum TaxID=2904250 RepID=UPI001F1A2BEF|nr:NAD(P)/FAD-dependent oxidoreductase [Microbulbifer sediminum]